MKGSWGAGMWWKMVGPGDRWLQVVNVVVLGGGEGEVVVRR